MPNHPGHEERAEREIVGRLRRNADFQKRQGWGNNGLLNEVAAIIAEQDRRLERLSARAAESDGYRRALKKARVFLRSLSDSAPSALLHHACNREIFAIDAALTSDGVSDPNRVTTVQE